MKYYYKKINKLLRLWSIMVSMNLVMQILEEFSNKINNQFVEK